LLLFFFALKVFKFSRFNNHFFGKESTMKRMLMTLCLTWAGFAFGNPLTDSHSLNFSGVWKTPAGYKGKWESVATFEKVEQQNQDAPKVIRMTTDLTIYHDQETHKENYTIDFIMKDNGFYDVRMGEAIVGSGYCHPHYCHHTYSTAEGEQMEEGYAHFHKRIVTSGSSNSKEHGVVAWRGRAKMECDDQGCQEQDDQDGDDQQQGGGQDKP
jgi:hypothetical protein